ncbi:uncharacterized protein LOC115052351 [Echeneis naucrates]|uniref:uncharacterized protein LOC115052351 n=1 Tax=Echeneis naucrates TaxID=173247 RepID=UPI001113F837|nr:uncharacterized protein LOC115052351 [Echeneis naucrates]
MYQVEKRLIEEVRKYEHLYNSSSPHYKDCQMTQNSWREISRKIGLDLVDCLKRWKNLRDKYVRLRKKLAIRRGEPGGGKVPAFYNRLSWLAPHVKHREMESIYDAQEGTPPYPTSPASSMEPSSPSSDNTPMSPVSWIGQKRKRSDQDELYMNQLAELQDKRLELHQRLAQDTRDECSRFGETAADFLRRVPNEKRPDVMLKVLQLLHGNLKQE